MQDARLAFRHASRYFATVSKRTRPKKPAKLRSWSVSLIKKRGQYLGTVQAPNENAAEAEAVVEFDLSTEQRRRLVVSERH